MKKKNLSVYTCYILKLENKNVIFLTFLYYMEKVKKKK